MSTPLNSVKERFETKAKLVAAVEELMSDELWLPRLNSDRGGAKGLKHVSNSKLLRLHDLLSEVKKQFGSRDKLVDAVLDTDKRSKDEGYRAKLQGYPVPRLYDLYQSVQRRAARKTKKGA